jgi:hypothetical protein
MLTRHAIVLLGLLGSASAASAQNFRIEDVPSATALDVAQLKPNTIAFNDHSGGAVAESDAYLVRFDDWASKHPNQKKFLSLFARPASFSIERRAASISAVT